MSSPATRLTPVATAKIKSVRLSGKTRVKRIREVFIKRGIALRKRKKQIAKLKKKRDALEKKVKELEGYSDRQEALVKKHEWFIANCVANLPKIGKVPIVCCTDCGKSHPLTHYKLRVSLGSTGKHWSVHAECRACLHERNKAIDEKRKEISEAARDPLKRKEHIRQMSQAIITKLAGSII